VSDWLRRALPTGLELEPSLVASLTGLYRTPGRVYHTLQHVKEIARHFEEVGHAQGWKSPRETFLALLFHDAIYEPGAKDNEVRSASAAREAIARWLPLAGIDVDRVSRLILLTAEHGKLRAADVDRDAAFFLDCDMAILGAEPRVFDAYDRAIAAEYCDLPRALYVAGRGAFLSRLLESDRIFLSDYFHERLDEAARDNLRRALGLITSS
jgi:predicted metal-dependent HD superfamily phosphohydrolase